MKKSLLALAGIVCLGQSALAQTAEEVTVVSEQEDVVYVNDNNQGLLINSFKSDWFITAQGGASVMFSHLDSKRDFINRIQPAAAVYIGKWFTPVVGVRLGADWFISKGVSDFPSYGVNPKNRIDEYYSQKHMQVGPTFDVMFNLTNLICGYNPNRVYNLSAYAGAGFYFTLARQYDADGSRTRYKNCHDVVLTGRVGLINSFRVSDHWQLFLDLRFAATDNVPDESDITANKTAYQPQAYIGFNYNFGKSTTWTAPVVPVCPPAENCDVYRNALAAAQGDAQRLEMQLRGCMNAPKVEAEEIVEECDAPLCTIYFPIGVSSLTREDVRVLNAVSEIIKDNPDTDYVVTGWADNYTGNDAINTNLRTRRAENVANQLYKAGVNRSQVTTTINDQNLYGNNKKYMTLDRAATVQVAK